MSSIKMRRYLLSGKNYQRFERQNRGSHTRSRNSAKHNKAHRFSVHYAAKALSSMPKQQKLPLCTNPISRRFPSLLSRCGPCSASVPASQIASDLLIRSRKVSNISTLLLAVQTSEIGEHSTPHVRSFESTFRLSFIASNPCGFCIFPTRFPKPDFRAAPGSHG